MTIALVNHRLQPEKECGFEEDINVPLLVRGPRVPGGQVSDIVTSHTDLTPTFLSLAGASPKTSLDGAVIPLIRSGIDEAVHTRHEHVNVEYWGFTLTEVKCEKAVYWKNTYKALRLIGSDYNLYYSVWCSGEHELYDMNVRPCISRHI
jgi:arylsulfatase A-like enzyme